MFNKKNPSKKFLTLQEFYRSLHAGDLTNEEKNSIKVLSQGAALRFLLTRVFDALNTVKGAIVKIKDPIEYLKRLEFHKNSKNYEDYFF